MTIKNYPNRPWKTVDTTERQARYICGNLFEHSWHDWNDECGFIIRIVAKALLADHYSERTRESWIELANVLENASIDKTHPNVKKAFARMVRAGYLYGRKARRGKYNYGIRFNS